MTDLADAHVAATVEIAADPGTVYRMITDLPTLAELAEETTSMQWVTGDAAVPGAKFKGSNSHGSKTWTTTCTVTHAEGVRLRLDVLPALKGEDSPAAMPHSGCFLLRHPSPQRVAVLCGLHGRLVSLPARQRE
jgi:Polyketide cyclase / dehydrase and lipid transport